MAIVNQIGETLAVGAETITGSYIVESQEVYGYDVDSEDINDEDGALSARLIYKRHPKTRLSLICIEGAAPNVDFPEGQIAVHADFPDHYVDSAKVTKSKSAQRAEIELTNIGVTL